MHTHGLVWIMCSWWRLLIEECNMYVTNNDRKMAALVLAEVNLP